MKTIYKYNLAVESMQIIYMPIGSKILSVQNQEGKIAMWAMVDTEKRSIPRKFFIYGTGNPIPENHGKYIGTVQRGAFVWHIFEFV